MLHVRAADANDSRLLWEWRNDPLVCAMSFRHDTIPWSEHDEWFRRTRAADDCRIWIAEEDGRAVGQVRYERVGSTLTLSYSVARECRGRGVGATMLTLTLARACRELQAERVVGSVLPGNAASRVTFERAGFRLRERHDTRHTYEWTPPAAPRESEP